MSHRAYVAFEADGGDSFDIHASHNGADQYQLRPALKEYLAGDVGRSLNTAEGTQALSDMARELTMEIDGKAKRHDVVDPDPTMTDVPKEAICSAIPSWDADVVYLVEDGTVETYIPIVPNPAAIHKLPRVLRLKLSKFDPSTNRQNAIEQPPDVILESQDDFSPEELSTQPDWVEKTIEQAHRNFIANLPKLRNSDKEIATFYGDIVVRQEVSGPLPERVPTSPSVPIEVSFDDGTPEYPMEDMFELNIATTQPKAFAAKARYELWPRFYEVISTTDEAEQATNAGIELSTVLLNLLADQYGNRIADPLLNDRLGEIIDGIRDDT